jgi:S-(hydroxymethyl)glutathione dehydrogenase/alcohol dehydrogenase
VKGDACAVTEMRALVVEDYGQEPRVETVTIDDPGPTEVKVRLVASGVCHSDWHVVTATLPLPVPVVLGHEGSGVVDAVGSAVTRVKPGDHVVLHWIPACGQCFWCRHGQPELCEAANYGAVHGALQGAKPRLHWRGGPLYPFSLTGTLAEVAVVPEAAVTPIPDDMPWDEAALLGCAVLTGVGAAWRSPIAPGDTVAVIGAGGVGLNVVQGARLKGAERVIVVDPVAWKRDLALTLGATDVVDPASRDPLDVLLQLTDDRGVDVAFEVVGRPDLLALAFNAARRGGTAVAVGVPAPHEEVTLNAFAFPSQEKTLTGSWYGGSDPARDVPRIIAWWREGRLRLRPLITHTYSLDQAPTAFHDMLNGVSLRGMVWLDPAARR